MRRIRVALASCLALVALAAVPGGAVATSPEVNGPEMFKGTVELTDCGTFKVLDDFEATLTFRWFTDKEGNIVKGLINLRETDSIYNSVTGERYTIPYGATIHIDPVAGERTYTGVVVRVNVPGAGAVLLDVGRSTTDLSTGDHPFVAGPHQLLEGDTAALCAALA